MKALYCQYCGEPLEERCNCLSEIAEAEEQWKEDYYNSPEIKVGWRNEDLIAFGHFNQR